MRGAVPDCCNSQTLHTSIRGLVRSAFFGGNSPSFIYILSLCNVNLHTQNTSGVALPFLSFVNEVQSWSLLQFLEGRFLHVLYVGSYSLIFHAI